MPQPPRLRTPRLLLVIALTAVAAVTWWAWPRPLPVDTVVVTRGAVASSVVDLGETRVREAFTVTAPVQGQVRRITLEPGDTVSQGQVLAQIEPSSSTPLDARSRAQLDASLRQAQATRERARAAFALARDEASRVGRLWARRLVSEHDQLTAQNLRAEAQAALGEAEAGVARIEAELAERTPDGATAIDLPSPITGKVLARYVESAKPVAVGEALLELGNPDDLDVVAEFLSQDAARLHEGSPAWIEAWGGPPVAARIRRISPSGRLKVSALGVEERRVEVWLDPTEPLTGAGHGFQVEVRVQLAEAPASLRVPVEALMREAEGWRVWRVVEGRAVATPVEVGITDGRWRVVQQGLAEGDVVVAAPKPSLRDGARVASRPVTTD